MVSGIETIKTVTPVNNQKAVTNLLKYASDQALEQAPDTFVSTTKSAAGSSMVFEGIPLLRFLYKSKKTQNTLITNGMKSIGEYNKTALKNILHGEGKLTERIKNYISTVQKSKNAYLAERSSVSALNKAEKVSNKLSKILEKNPDKIISEKKLLRLDKLKDNAISKATASRDARILIGQNAGEAAGKLSKLGKFRKMLKSSGAGLMLVVSGVTEFFSEIYPTFKELGVKKGLKQLGKSAIKVAGDTFGFIAGENAGMILGTTIGTAICPGIGSAVGALCGLVGGMFGSFAMGKLTKAITGPTEREKAKNAQNEIQADEILKNEEELNKLKSEVLNKILADQADDGELTQDSLIAAQSLTSLEESNPFNI